MSKEISRLRRKLRRRQNSIRANGLLESPGLPLKPPKVSPTIPVILADEDEVVEEHEDKVRHVSEYFEKLFTPPEPDHVPKWVCKKWSAWEAAMTQSFITVDMVRKAILSLADGRTCASDEVVAEMLKVLEAEELRELCCLFNLRLRNEGSAAADTLFQEFVVHLIRKKPHTCKISEFRPIAILSVVYKVYSKCLLKLALCTCVFACLRSFFY